jgi:carboxyl-terminal processing protease
VNINGRNLKGQSLDYAVDLIKGRLGTSMTLGVRRDGRNLNPVTVTRRRVTVYSISDVQMVDPTVGYLKLDKFAKTSSAEMDEALWSLYGQGMESLIIDLRGNPGGLLTAAIELSDKFLPCGTIVSTRGRTAGDQSMEYAKYDHTWKLPLVVLVDENSASASEIFAAAIKENQRGLVVGRRSYGKGTVQTHFPLQSVPGNLRLTTANFYSPTGRVMAGAGVEPDVKVEFTYNPTEIVPVATDRDIAEALSAAKGTQVRALAQSKSGCRIPATPTGLHS